jgi:hypothetical protein
LSSCDHFLLGHWHCHNNAIGQRSIGFMATTDFPS